MQLKIYHDYEALSSNAADEIVDCVKNKPDAVLVFASGDTPRLTYRLTAEKAKAQKIDFSKVTFVGLDEWMGIPPDNPGSCHYFLYENVFNLLGTDS
jgi:galactosamine-6-phosphate isomerase